MWGTVLATALGVGALAGAGQLGVAYGLGLVRFARTFPTDGLWSTQLTWVAWFAALASLAGGVAGAGAARRYALVRQLGGRILVAAAGGLGATIVVPLTALPADAAGLVGRETAAPSLEVALAAGLGAVVGILAAVAALSVRLVAVSLTLLVTLVWLIALVSVAPALAPTADLPEVRLGVLDLPAAGGPGPAAAVLTPAIVALLVCAGIAVAARYRGLSPLLAAVSSTAAPGLLALVYLIGSPGTGERAVQAAPYAGALLAVAAGLLVSLAIGVIRLPSAGGVDGPDGSEPVSAPGPEPVTPPGPEPVGAPPATPPSPTRPPEPEPEPEPEPKPEPERKQKPKPKPEAGPKPEREPRPIREPRPEPPAPRSSRRRGHRREEQQEQHVGWISALAGRSGSDEAGSEEAGSEEAGSGGAKAAGAGSDEGRSDSRPSRRRLRRDRDRDHPDSTGAKHDPAGG